MYISSLSPASLANARRIVDSFAKWTLQALEEGVYDIYFEHDVINNALFYTALIKNRREISKRFIPESLCFGISEKGELLQEISYLSAPLIVFIQQSEASLSEEELRNIYGDIYETTQLTAGLSPEEAAIKMNDRKEFDAFLTKLSKVKEEKTEQVNKKFDARFHFSFGYYPTVGVTIITENGATRVGHLPHFFDALRSKGTYKLSSKESIIVESNSFRPPYDSAISTFMNGAKLYYRTKVESGEVTEGSLVALFELLIGETIYIDDKKTSIQESDPVSISLNNGGAPTFYPPFGLRGYSSTELAFKGNSGIFVYDKAKEEILYHPYGSSAVKETYLYFEAHQDKEFSYIKDLFVSKLLPKISSSLKAPSASKASKNGFFIRLYLSIDDKSRLAFKTTYEENGEEIKRKDIQTEYGKSLSEAYLALLTSLGGLEHGTISSQEGIYEFLTKDLTPISRLAQIYYEDRIKPAKVKTLSGLRIIAQFEGDYLGLTLDSDQYDRETLSAVLAAKHEKKKFVLLKDSTILLDSAELEEAASIFEEDDTYIKDAPIYRLFSLEKGRIKIQSDERSRKVLQAILDFASYPLSLPESLNETLRPYQKGGVRYLLTLADNRLGGILADEMGLGKTVQAIAYMVAAIESQPILILSPKAVLYNWLSEINRFSSLDATIIDGNRSHRESIIASIDKNRKAVYLVSYDTFRRDAELYESIDFGSAILDEAQSVKNAFSQRHKALTSIHATHRFALTGTPLENSPLDLWSIYDFLMPGYLGDFDHFSSFIMKPGYQETLAGLLKPFTLRRKKEDVLKDLPPKTETNILIQMEEDQRMLYLAYLNKAREAEFIQEGSRLSVLAALTRLRQICVDPSSFLEDFESVSSKLNYCKDMLIELKNNGHKALVFSSFKTVLLHLKEIAEEEGLNVGVITGDTSGKDRLDLANSFNKEDSNLDAMLVSLKAGGVGLNLVGADMVIHLDPWWNPASESQASDRAHRIGQTRPVSIFRLIAKDSIEEKVQLLQENKRHLFDDLIEEGGGASMLTEEDIRFLLS